ncbi:MAG TPA: SDR family NAD(P)-dependent oxidoreductase [Ignavibacteria bacterium]|nr:SDR family NAD(P)-dependent oxidoreductase [Ignavibacteria bacterium]HMR39291.1 SDR family NAD(P)-dependent oxidoreductase [Ignavibacteria bacterium]
MNNKVAIVTGGTGALGRFIVNKFADEGIKVYVPARSTDEFNSVFDNSHKKESEYFKLRKIYCKTCDATNETSVQEFVENVAALEQGKIDYLVNTVGGISSSENVTELSSDTLNKMISLNFNSTFYFTRDTAKVMSVNNYGRIVSIGAIAGTEISPGRFAYSFSKAGVISLMETLSEELKDKNIRCNTLIPGIIDTPANREWGSADDIKDWVRPEEISDVIYEIISDRFSTLRSSRIKMYGSY